MLRSAFLMMGLIVLTTVSSASAGAVQWAGVLSTKTGTPTLLNVSVPSSFTGVINATAGLADTGFFTGSLVFGSQTMNITVGSIQRSPTQLTFQIAQANNDRNIGVLFTFNGTFAGWALGDTAAMDAVVGTLFTSNINGSVAMLELNNVPSIVGGYTGSVQSVPEPSSAIALIGLGVGFGIRYRRRLLSKK